MQPVNQTLEVWSGNSEYFPFALSQEDVDEPFDLTGSKLVFIAKTGSTTMRKASDDPGSGFEITDAANGEFLLQFTVAETRAWPDKTVLRYEIERWVGSDQESLIFGNINVTQWVNDDADP